MLILKYWDTTFNWMLTIGGLSNSISSLLEVPDASKVIFDIFEGILRLAYFLISSSLAKLAIMVKHLLHSYGLNWIWTCWYEMFVSDQQRSFVTQHYSFICILSQSVHLHCTSTLTQTKNFAVKLYNRASKKILSCTHFFYTWLNVLRYVSLFNL